MPPAYNTYVAPQGTALINPNSSQASLEQWMRAGTINGNTQPIWDSAFYPSAGTPKVSFFQQPIGQQILNGAAGALKSYADTSFDQSAQIGAGTAQRVMGLELHVFPGQAIGQEAEGEAAIAPLSYADDVLAIARYGWAEIYLQSNNLVQRIPLLLCPPSTGLSGYSALSDATTAAGTQRSSINYAALSGDPMQFSPFWIPPNTAFRVDLQWQNNAAPGVAPALPSGTSALMRLVLKGQNYRNA